MKLQTKKAGAALASVLLLGAFAPACEGSDELPAENEEVDPPAGLEESPREEES